MGTIRRGTIGQGPRSSNTNTRNTTRTNTPVNTNPPTDNTEGNQGNDQEETIDQGVNKAIYIPLLYDNMFLNLALAFIVHCLIAAIPTALFLMLGAAEEFAFAAGVPLGILLAGVLFVLQSTHVQLGQAGIPTFFFRAVDAFVSNGLWWTPCGSMKLYNSQYDPIIIEPFEGWSKEGIGEDGKYYETVPITKEKSSVIIIPTSSRFFTVDPKDIAIALQDSIMGEELIHMDENTYKDLLRGGRKFERKLLDKDNERLVEEDDLKQLQRDFGFKIAHYNLGKFKLDADFANALKKAAIERRECAAEDIEVAHVTEQISKIADTLIAKGMDRSIAAERAAIIYQNQVGKALGINFMGGDGGDFTKGAALTAAAGRRG